MNIYDDLCCRLLRCLKLGLADVNDTVYQTFFIRCDIDRLSTPSAEIY
jgi:hypothetical protein